MRFEPSAVAERGALPLVIGFLDLTRFAAQSRCVDDAELAEILDQFFGQIDRHVSAAGGYVVKYMGDGALFVFHRAAADDAVCAVLDLKEAVDAAMKERGWECRLKAQLHVGTAVVGRFGAERRIDVIGQAVNTAAMLDSTGVALSVAAFRALGAEVRRKFKKHTPPVSYIRLEDPRRFRYRPM